MNTTPIIIEPKTQAAPSSRPRTGSADPSFANVFESAREDRSEKTAREAQEAEKKTEDASVHPESAEAAEAAKTDQSAPVAPAGQSTDQKPQQRDDPSDAATRQDDQHQEAHAASMKSSQENHPISLLSRQPTLQASSQAQLLIRLKDAAAQSFELLGSRPGGLPLSEKIPDLASKRAGAPEILTSQLKADGHSAAAERPVPHAESRQEAVESPGRSAASRADAASPSPNPSLRDRGGASSGAEAAPRESDQIAARLEQQTHQPPAHRAETQARVEGNSSPSTESQPAQSQASPAPAETIAAKAATQESPAAQPTPPGTATKGETTGSTRTTTTVENPPSPVDDPDLVSQIVQRARLLTRNGQETLEVQLKPDILGKLIMRVEVAEHLMTAQVTVQSEQVKTLLESQLQSLQNAIEAGGVRLHRFSIHVADSQASDGRNAGHWGRGQRDGEPSRDARQSPNEESPGGERRGGRRRGRVRITA